MEDVVLSADEAEERLIRRKDMVACSLAFIDCKMPGSHLKQNYAMIGPGVTQSADQVINLREAHGFNIGGAAMPPGITNNLHIHFTAEVFLIWAGRWRFRWGDPAEGGGEVDAGPGDVVSVPTWIFRGFTNVGEDDGWINTILGGDDTGGIIWHPSILRGAAEHGLYLTQDNMLVDTAAGQPAPDEGRRLQPLSPAQVAALRRYTPEEMRRRVVFAADLAWSPRALLSACLPGRASELAPVIGPGMTADRDHAAPLANPHGFSVEWLRMPGGNETGRFRLAQKQVVMVREGRLRLAFNAPGAEQVVELGPYDMASVPAGTWRSLKAMGDGPLEVALVTSGDERARPEWAPELVQEAARAGWVLDPGGFVAERAFLPPASLPRELRAA